MDASTGASDERPRTTGDPTDGHPELPLDSDVEPGRRGERLPPHLQPHLVALVFVGGSVGTLARWATGLVVPHVLRVPFGTLAVNVAGAFVLGLLLERLAPHETGARRVLRVTLGTGFCGGFTTYSALANDSATLLRSGLVGHALAYVAATLVLGLLASALGVAAGRRRTAPGVT